MLNTRGLRNNNPGNIRHNSLKYDGETVSEDKAFKKFVSMPYGYRAIFVILYTYSKKYGLNRLGQLIDRWAPPVENDTKAYIRHVEQISGLKESDVVNFDNPGHMKGIVNGISRHENGVSAKPIDVNHGWELYAKFRGLK